MSLSKQIISQYTFSVGKPSQVYSNLSVYDAHSKQTNLPYTLKIIKNPDFKLEEYFKKIKNIVSDFVIKIYEFAYDTIDNVMVIVQQHCSYGTLQKALSKCKRLDDDDSIFVSKMLLNGHIDLLRAGVSWFGDENDIQITQNGVRLSWNNSMNFNSHCPFPELISRIGVRKNQSSILPFPKNKSLNDLINVSKQNASQISLHPLLKKKQKVFKKKGNKWLAIRQFKVKGEYFEELSYLAVSQNFGFVRVKCLEKGQCSDQIIKIHQTKASFVKILDYYEENHSFFTISEYANDGTLQSYVKKLKSSNMSLKQNQIQFFFFSMINPLKFIHQSHAKSLNMLHIRNIYIENGVPKIGEPVPITPNLKEKLNERADVPDFYHHNFKSGISIDDPRNDTYSLGVLLYKLMYTQYPIFPEKQVHIPSAPSYKKNLKYAIELFLNEGGHLDELEQKLEISDDVKLEVKNNEKILEQVTIKNKEQQVTVSENKIVEDSQIEFHEQRKEDERQSMNFLARFWKWLTTRGKDIKGKYRSLYKSEFDGYRICTTIFIVLLFYFFTFFYFFMDGALTLLNVTRYLTPYMLSIKGVNHTVIIPNFNNFTLQYKNHPNDSALVLNQTMNCILNEQEKVYNFINPVSPHWYIFIGLGIVAMVAFLFLKGYQLYKYSTVRAGFHHYDTTLEGSTQSRFALSTFIYFHLWQGLTLFCFYYLFNIVYHQQHSPCLGKKQWTNLTDTLMKDRLKFITDYLIIICVCFLFFVLNIIHLKFHHSIRYNRLVNPIFIYTPFYLTLFIMMRIGAFSPFVPSYVSNSEGIIGSSYMNMIGYIPEVLIIIQMMICVVIDLIFQKCVSEKIRKFTIEQIHSQELKLNK